MLPWEVPDVVPFLVSTSNYRLGVAFDQDRVFFLVRWNSRDAAWYFDLLAEDDTVIVLGVKVVLGVSLGHRSKHPWLAANILTVVDTSGQNLDAGFDDLGARVVVVHSTLDELISGAVTPS